MKKSMVISAICGLFVLIILSITNAAYSEETVEAPQSPGEIKIKGKNVVVYGPVTKPLIQTYENMLDLPEGVEITPNIIQLILQNPTKIFWASSREIPQKVNFLSTPWVFKNEIKSTFFYQDSNDKKIKVSDEETGQPTTVPSLGILEFCIKFPPILAALLVSFAVVKNKQWLIVFSSFFLVIIFAATIEKIFSPTGEYVAMFYLLYPVVIGVMCLVLFFLVKSNNLESKFFGAVLLFFGVLASMYPILFIANQNTGVINVKLYFYERFRVIDYLTFIILTFISSFLISRGYFLLKEKFLPAKKEANLTVA